VAASRHLLTDLEEKLMLKNFYADWSIYESSSSQEGTISLAGVQHFDNGLAIFKSRSTTCLKWCFVPLENF
jgi:hypothetical protein